MRKSFLQALWDFIAFPIRAFAQHEGLQKLLYLTTLKEERLGAVRPFLQGRVIDVGCGTNELIRSYRKAGGEGVGVDVFPFEGVDTVADTAHLPFSAASFDTACLVANLNHIPRGKRKDVVREIHRALRPRGRLIVTMISPFVGWLNHRFAFWDPDLTERHMDHREEDEGLPASYVTNLIQENSFRLLTEERFLYGLNALFVFERVP